MKCWIVQYHHRHGTDSWPVFRERKPYKKQVVKTIENWEGDEREDEWINIIGPFEIPKSTVKRLSLPYY